MKILFDSLHERALQLAKTYLRTECELIEVLQKIDHCRGYRQIEYKSLFEYTTRALGLSPAVAYNLITVSRKAAEVPQLQGKIRTGEISLSSARKIAPVLTTENQEEWISAAARLSSRELERKIAQTNPLLSVPERTRYVSENRLELKLGISVNLHAKLQRAQDLLSSRLKKAATLEELLEVVVGLYLNAEDPLASSVRAKERRQTPNESYFSERYIPAQVRREVTNRDNHQCTHLRADGSRCPERRWLDIHHIQPVSEGGPTTVSNLRTVCKGHHQMIHWSVNERSILVSPYSLASLE